MILSLAFGWKLVVCYLNVFQRFHMILTNLLVQTMNGYYLQYSCPPIEVLVRQSALVEGSIGGAAYFQEP